jgi:hypothetical protein
MYTCPYLPQKLRMATINLSDCLHVHTYISVREDASSKEPCMDTVLTMNNVWQTVGMCDKPKAAAGDAPDNSGGGGDYNDVSASS